jgi:hypothetical protein
MKTVVRGALSEVWRYPRRHRPVTHGVRDLRGSPTRLSRFVDPEPFGDKQASRKSGVEITDETFAFGRGLHFCSRDGLNRQCPESLWVRA